MKSKDLKQIVGAVYFIMYAVIIKNISIINSGITRALLCLSFACLGLGFKAAVYYGLFKTGQDKELTRPEMETIIFNYMIYGFKAIVLICFFYLIFFKTLRSINLGQFFIVTFFIFSYIGFFSDEMALPYIEKK